MDNNIINPDFGVTELELEAWEAQEVYMQTGTMVELRNGRYYITVDSITLAIID